MLGASSAKAGPAEADSTIPPEVLRSILTFDGQCVLDPTPTMGRGGKRAAKSKSARMLTEGLGDEEAFESRGVTPPRTPPKSGGKGKAKKGGAACRPRARHICPTCDKRLDTKYKLDRHFRTHTGEKPFWCKKCETRFNQKSSLKTHSAIHARTFLREGPSDQEVRAFRVNEYSVGDLGYPILESMAVRRKAPKPPRKFRGRKIERRHSI
jgi:hypothetical protein